MDDISQAYCARFKPASMDVPSLVNKRDIVTVKVTDLGLSTDYELILEMIVSTLCFEHYFKSSQSLIR